MRNEKKKASKKERTAEGFIFLKLMPEVCRDCSHANYKINYICACIKWLPFVNKAVSNLWKVGEIINTADKSCLCVTEIGKINDILRYISFHTKHNFN